MTEVLQQKLRDYCDGLGQQIHVLEAESRKISLRCETATNIRLNSRVTNWYNDAALCIFSRYYDNPLRWRHVQAEPFRYILEDMAKQDDAARILVERSKAADVWCLPAILTGEEICRRWPLEDLQRRFVRRQIGEVEYTQIADGTHSTFTETR